MNVSVVPLEIIERKIYLIRNSKVLLDQDLAELYDVKPKALIQAVKRNLDRFPDDFMFQLTRYEAAAMRSQSVTASKRNIRYLPYAFTQEGENMEKKYDAQFKVVFDVIRQLTKQASVPRRRRIGFNAEE